MIQRLVVVIEDTIGLKINPFETKSMEDSSVTGRGGEPRRIIVLVITRDLELNSLSMHLIHDRALSRFLNHAVTLPIKKRLLLLLS